MSILLRIVSLNFILGSVLGAQTNFWEPTGLDSVSVYALVINASGHIFAGASAGFDSGKVFRSTDNGTTWNSVNSNVMNPQVYTFVINSSGHIFAGTMSGLSSGAVFRSTDNGQNWMACFSGAYVLALATDPSGYIYVGTCNGVFRSTDSGTTWDSINTGLTNRAIAALAVNSSGHIYAGTCNGVFRSTDNGDNWTQTNLTNFGVSVLAVNSNGQIFATPYDNAGWGHVYGVYRSTDDGESWTEINTGLTNLCVLALAINSSGHIFAGTGSGGGVYRSTDNGNNWTEINVGLSTTRVNALAISTNGYIFAGTDSGGVFRSVRSTTSVNKTAAEIPAGFALEQNFPNPFNPSTVIRYSLSARGRVRLKVYNMLGQEVATLIDQEQSAGSYDVLWDARGLVSGVYSYRLQVGELAETRKLILLQ